jgi:DNA-binding SARP family transcriptional activator/TolB-like protein
MHQSPFQLRILGHTEFSGPDPDKAGLILRQSKRLALLAYLAVATADGFKRRDQITALFWPELDQAQARTYLRKALYGIRESLGEDLFTSRGEDELRVDPVRLWCDAVALGQCVREERWSDALTLYRGELLEGLFPEGVAQEFQEWLSLQRTALRQLAARAAWECSRLEEERGDRTAAALMARRARELDPDNEEGVRRLMGLLDRRGDRGGALRVYAEWQTRLAEEFSVEPDPETRKLARRIQAARKGESNEPPFTNESLPRVHARAAVVDPPPVEPPVAARVSVTVTRSRWLPYVGVGVLAGILVGAGGALMRAPDVPDLPNSLAVLPLTPIGDSTLRSLAELVSEEMTTALAQDSSLTVRSAIGAVDPRRGAAYLVAGGIQRVAGKLRVTLRLIDTRTSVTAWARSVELEESDAGLLGQRVASASAPAIAAVIKKTRLTKPQP